MKVSKGSSKWKNGFSKVISKNQKVNHNFIFESIETGNDILLQDCLYDDLLPQSIRSSPISSLSKEDNMWIATSMLNRVSDTTDNIVIMEKEYPAGIISAKEILLGVLKNPTQNFFDKTFSHEVMNRKFYLDTRKAKLSEILSQMNITNRTFAIIQNSKYDFTSISNHEILEIGAMCNIDDTQELDTNEKVILCKRDSSVKEVIELLLQDEIELVQLKGESLVIDRQSIIRSLTTSLNFLNNIDDFLELNTTIFQFQAPKLIPENLAFPEICKLMLEMKFPYLISSKRIWTPLDVVEILSKGVE